MLHRTLALGAILFTALSVCPAPAEARRTSPVDGGTVTSGTGWRLDPFGTGRMMYHNGYDIAVPMGTPVHPVESGTVYFAGTYKGYGEMVAIDHGNGYLTIYGHNSAVKVRAGEKVTSDSVIALSGTSGRSTGPHVHYEMRMLPNYQKVQRAKMEKDLKQLVENKIGGWVEGQVKGNAGPHLNGGGMGGGSEFYLPDDLNE
ncbi:M23 family metallopeptidase [Geomonas sp. RF6]|uniref:M23 family metallopeptidase n=1 Tax=Geomonas sp. RF6 TaxID=2897342 RepID=UPI001E63E0E5|nr:M23 family metallopeptidase [Geomonas sp. RF6]UFS71678.1 M23 family metallopeptidase [Geomonas sp. RF6]